jgi:hypothetical protein
MVAWNMVVEIEGAEESVLAATMLTHHLDVLPLNRLPSTEANRTELPGSF